MILHVNVSVEEDDIIEALSHEDAMKLIKKIDLAMADYDFTESLAKYFIQELIKERTALGEVLNPSELF